MYILESSPRFKSAFKIAEILKNHGYRVLFAGGSVRDALMGNPPADIDIATSARPEQIQKLFRNTQLVGAQFGVCIVITDKTPFEVATFRKDGSYSDGRHPDQVTFSDEKEDALRRDFTVNGLFYDPFTKEVLDYIGGRNDIQRRIIRTIGRPEDRFNEDRLRILRAFRFSARLEFTIEEETLNSIQSMAEGLKTVSRERVRDEIFKMFKSKSIHSQLELLQKTGMWETVFSFPYNPLNAEWVATYHHPDFPHLRLFTLYHNLNEKYFLAVRDNFRLTNKELKDLTFLLGLLKLCNNINSVRTGFLLHQLKYPQMNDFMGFIKSYAETILKTPDTYATLENLFHKNLNLISKPPFITGDDLLRLGLKPSALFKQILDEMEFRRLETKLSSREEALLFLSENLNSFKDQFLIKT